MADVLQAYTAHQDSFARDRLPPRALWPRLDFTALPALAAYPVRLNAAVELLDRMVAAGHGARPVFHFPGGRWSYAELLDRANRVAAVLREDCGLVPGNRVLLRGVNGPMLAACWFGVLKAGGICVATMPLLRARELAYIVDKAQIRLALCDHRLLDELDGCRKLTPTLRDVMAFGDPEASLERHMRAKTGHFANVETAADDVALIAFTSGTTGPAKGTVHFHRDIIACTDCFPRHVLKAGPDDVFIGSPPFAFTFGLGALLLFPMRAGASVAFPEQVTPARLLEAIPRFGATVCFTAPTAYRAMTAQASAAALSGLRTCVSAGETLPLPTFEDWERATGIRIIDGLGSTEMLHIFIAAAGRDIRPGATGRAIPGYRARVVDEAGRELPPGTVGLLAVQGPTGCRYLDNVERQQAYVRDGWNYTGDAYVMDEDGYFWYQARTDDMIVSAGYNISGPEVENVLLEHPDVAECGVVGVPDPERGQVVKAFVVLRHPERAGPEMARLLQEHVKNTIAPYKYPRAVAFVTALPRTETGKLQRFRLREAAQAERRN